MIRVIMSSLVIVLLLLFIDNMLNIRKQRAQEEKDFVANSITQCQNKAIAQKTQREKEMQRKNDYGIQWDIMQKECAGYTKKLNAIRE